MCYKNVKILGKIKDCRGQNPSEHQKQQPGCQITPKGIKKSSTKITTKSHLDKTKTKALTPKSESSKVKK